MKRWLVGSFLGLTGLLVSQGVLSASDPSAVLPLASGSSPIHDVTLSLNLIWVLLAAFLVFFMQAGFALIETGLTRAKNAAHTMAMNVGIFCLGTIGFWSVGFALMYGGRALRSPWPILPDRSTNGPCPCWAEISGSAAARASS